MGNRIHLVNGADFLTELDAIHRAEQHVLSVREVAFLDATDDVVESFRACCEIGSGLR